jgi:hypothetical protein
VGVERSRGSPSELWWGVVGDLPEAVATPSAIGSAIIMIFSKLPTLSQQPVTDPEPPFLLTPVATHQG